HIADWEKFYNLPRKWEAVFCAAISPESPETRGQRGQYREYRNQNVEDRELSRFHAQAPTLPVFRSSLFLCKRGHLHFYATLGQPTQNIPEEPLVLSDLLRSDNTRVFDLSASHEQSDRGAWVGCCPSHC